MACRPTVPRPWLMTVTLSNLTCYTSVHGTTLVLVAVHGRGGAGWVLEDPPTNPGMYRVGYGLGGTQGGGTGSSRTPPSSPAPTTFWDPINGVLQSLTVRLL